MDSTPKNVSSQRSTPGVCASVDGSRDELTARKAKQAALEEQQLMLASDLMQVRMEITRASSKLGDGSLTTSQAARMHDYAARMMSEAIAVSQLEPPEIVAAIRTTPRPGSYDGTASLGASRQPPLRRSALSGSRPKQDARRQSPSSAWRPGGATARSKSAGRSRRQLSKTDQAQRALATRAARIRCGGAAWGAMQRCLSLPFAE